MKLSDLIGTIVAMSENFTAFAAHVDDTVAATSARGLVATMKAHNVGLRKMLAEAAAEETADHSADDLNAQEAAKTEPPEEQEAALAEQQGVDPEPAPEPAPEPEPAAAPVKRRGRAKAKR